MKLYIRSGYYSNGDVVYNFDGKYIRAGYYDNGDVIYNIDGKYIRAGYYDNGDVVYNIDDNYIRVGYYSNGDVKYNIDGNYIRAGYYSSGDVIFNITEESSSSGCFVTTACIESMGLSDKCYELKVLRRFRDQWVSHHDNGEKEIGIYYEIAPKIVDKLRQHENSKEIYAWIYKEMIQKCVRYIENGDDEAAYQLYKEMSYKLKDYTDKI